MNEDTTESIGTDSSNSDWEECDQIIDSSKCLFCGTTFKTCEETFEHSKFQHDFNIKKLKSALSLDCFSYIRLINFIRSEQLPHMITLSDEKLRNALTNDFYMKPVNENDALLMYDIDSVEPDDEAPKDNEARKKEEINDYQILNKQLMVYETKLKETEEQLQITQHQIQKMRDCIIEYIESDQCSNSSNRCNSDDEGYFQSYAHFSIHHEMLQDEIRTFSYRDAMLKNKELFKDKVVLDVGCGTGILSLFAAEAGASLVIGVDDSEIAYQAMDIINENNMQSRITILKGRMEDVNIPKNPVDVIVSEWMGYFLLFESMLETVINARDKYLISGGAMLPNRCNLLVAGVSDIDQHSKMILFWDNVYGFKMTCLKGDVIREAAITKVDGNKLITSPVIIHKLDLMLCTSENLNFSSSFQLVFKSDEPLTAIVAWFDTFFDLPNKVSFSTSPNDPATHWKQTVFYLRQPLIYAKGSCVDGKLRCIRPGKGPRLLQIELVIGDYREEYILQ